MPTKSQIVRFRTQVATAVAAVGRYQVRLFKNGAGFLTIYDATVSTAGNPLVMSGRLWMSPADRVMAPGIITIIVVFAGANFTLEYSQFILSRLKWWENRERYGRRAQLGTPEQ